MTDLELIFLCSGKPQQKKSPNQNAQGFNQNKKTAKKGGRIAGDARRDLEQESGKQVVSKANFLESLEPLSDVQPILEFHNEKKLWEDDIPRAIQKSGIGKRQCKADAA